MLTRLKPLVPLALWTCVAMVVLTELTLFSPRFWRWIDIDDEVPLAILGLAFMMAVWSAVIIATVFYPTMRLLDAAKVAFGRPWVYALAGVAVLPLATAMFVLVSGVFPGNDRTFVEQMAYMLRDPGRFAPLWIAGVGGGIVFGLGYGTRAGLCGPMGSVRSAGLGRL